MNEVRNEKIHTVLNFTMLDQTLFAVLLGTLKAYLYIRNHKIHTLLSP